MIPETDRQTDRQTVSQQPVGLSVNNRLFSELLTKYLEVKNMKRHRWFIKLHKSGQTLNGYNSPYQFLCELLVKHPDLCSQTAMSQDHDVSYDEMMDHVDRIASFLHSRMDVKKGEIISVCAISSIAGIEAFLAMNKLGLVNARIFNGTQCEKMHRDMLAFHSEIIMTDADNICVVCEAAKETAIRSIIVLSPKDKVPAITTTLQVFFWEDILQMPIEDDYRESAAADDLAAVLYTSGSSGDPKPISISNRVYVNMIELTSQTTDTKLNDGERVVGVVSHEYPYAAINSTLMILLMGKTLIMPKNEPDGKIDFRDLLSKKPYRIQAIPNFYKLLQSYLAENPGEDLSFLKNVVSGGETYTIAEKVSLQHSLKKVSSSPLIIDGFGFGEMGSATALKFGLSKYFLLMNGIEAMSVDPETNERLPEDVEGVLCITGPTISNGYYNDEASTAGSFIYDDKGTRWFKSDTYGYVHGKRRRRIVLGGRVREYFITGDGHGNFIKVYAGKVEAAILECDAVKDCIVVPSDDSALPTPIAYVSVRQKEQLTREEVICRIEEKCRSLEVFCRPTDYCFVEEIQRTKAGKKDYLYYKKRKFRK